MALHFVAFLSVGHALSVSLARRGITLTLALSHDGRGDKGAKDAGGRWVGIAVLWHWGTFWDISDRGVRVVGRACRVVRAVVGSRFS